MKWLLESGKSGVSHVVNLLERGRADVPANRLERFVSLLTSLSAVLAAFDALLDGLTSDRDDDRKRDQRERGNEPADEPETPVFDDEPPPF